MFGIGMPELVIIFVIALLVFGPKELPKIGKTIGRAMGEFRRASDELKDGIQREIEMVEREQSESTPSSEVSVETVPAEPPVAAAEPAPEPQLELPMARAPEAFASEDGVPKSESTTVAAGTPPAEPSAPVRDADTASSVKTSPSQAAETTHV